MVLTHALCEVLPLKREERLNVLINKLNMKKILVTWANGMLASDFEKLFSNKYELILANHKVLDITDITILEEYLEKIKPEVILNFAAYTAVDDAEDIWAKKNYDVNALWVYNLAKISNKFNIDFLTISSDYVFHGDSEKWYNEYDEKNPVNQYWMAKYLWEKLSLEENNNTIIVRTSWLYGGWKEYKNFVNTMINLWNKLDNLKVVNDQFGSPTNAKDLSEAIWKVIENIEKYRWKILHFSNNTEKNGITWYDFAKEIFSQTFIQIHLNPCTTADFPTKAKRPGFSKLINNSDIVLRDWKDGLRDYLRNL